MNLERWKQWRQEDAQEAAARRQRGAEEETAEDVWARRNQQAPSQRGWQALRRAHVDDASERVAANSECFICMDAPCTRKLRCGHQTCAECRSKIQQCPFCRRDIVQQNVNM